MELSERVRVKHRRSGWSPRTVHRPAGAGAELVFESCPVKRPSRAGHHAVKRDVVELKRPKGIRGGLVRRHGPRRVAGKPCGQIGEQGQGRLVYSDDMPTIPPVEGSA